MDEEESQGRAFKVVDRRRFSMDGEARDQEPEDEPETPEPAPAPRAQENASQPPAEADDAAEDPEAGPTTAGGMDFISFVASLASNALAALGMMQTAPGMPRQPPNPPMAREYIDIIEMLHAKTQGNLTARELEGMTRIMSDLRAAYMQAVGPR